MTERRLAAIFTADVAGFARLVAEDEEGTLARLDQLRTDLTRRVERSGGRVVDAVGDNLLAEFPSVVVAVECAIEAQRALTASEASVPERRRLLFRIGVHLGDVMVDDGRIAGDGVNVAARVEAMAEPGGVALSGPAFDQMEGRLDVGFEDLGHQDLKNIPRPVRVVRLQPGPRSFLPREALAGADELTVPGFGGRAALAVLPFENLSGDPDQEFFIMGLCEDLITRLSSFRSVPVISRTSAFAYKGRSMDLKQVSRELGVRYVVEGSVRRATTRVRVTAQLSDATNGANIWAERYDRELRDIFDVQDEISEAIVGALGRAVYENEAERQAQSEPGDLQAWDLYWRGWWTFRRLQEETNEEARAFFHRALKVDSRLAVAWTGLAMTHLYATMLGWSRDPALDIAELVRTAENAVASDPHSSEAQVAMGAALIRVGRPDAALASADRAIELNPSFAIAHWVRGIVLTWRNELDEAVESLLRATRLSPSDTFLFAMSTSLAMAHYCGGRFEEALQWSHRALQLRPDFVSAFHYRIFALARLGRLEEARRELEEARRYDPEDMAIRTLVDLTERGAPGLHAAIREGLDALGWDGLDA